MSSAPAQPAKAVSTQPQAGVEMNVISAQGSTNSSQTQHCEHHQHKVSRLRGGGAGKDCFLGLFGCFICFECCEGCCDCIADIICCPCEVCC
ncbi:hypothetical protein Moror_10822 [Moniliophthora roreri MCA 2997]|uniref:Cysteine-rich transmembrane CYSTM domain-containing protein n=1 Tax=Moniliophthora roreri (strain MCA 2997) TaxID=1381753 RepID=V2X2G9_MONRO|nr:hypothetical protein Moror_10822 [Moniliophthora roreri MCA 2997]